MNRQMNNTEMKLKERIKELEKKLAHYEDNCTSVWMIADVEQCCREMNYNRPSKEQGRDFLKYIERKEDASIGINWDTIYTHLSMWEADEDWPIKMPDDTYYEELNDTEWGDSPLNNREVEYNEA